MDGMTNPFFAPSTLPFGLPPFADIRDEHYRPAFDRGFAEQLAEVDAIVRSTEAPTVENTLLLLERANARPRGDRVLQQDVVRQQ